MGHTGYFHGQHTAHGPYFGQAWSPVITKIHSHDHFLLLYMITQPHNSNMLLFIHMNHLQWHDKIFTLQAKSPPVC